MFKNIKRALFPRKPGEIVQLAMDKGLYDIEETWILGSSPHMCVSVRRLSNQDLISTKEYNQTVDAINVELDYICTLRYYIILKYPEFQEGSSLTKEDKAKLMIELKGSFWETFKLKYS